MNILHPFGLERVKNKKTKKCLFLFTFAKSTIKNNSRTQLRSIFNKTVNRNKQKVRVF